MAAPVLAGVKLTLKERRYRDLARRYARAEDQIIKAAATLARIRPTMKRYEREFLKRGNYQALAMDGFEQAEAVLGPPSSSAEEAPE